MSPLEGFQISIVQSFEGVSVGLVDEVEASKVPSALYVTVPAV